MQGIQVSQSRAADLAAQGFEIYLNKLFGFWVRTDNISRDSLTYKIYKTGDEERNLPGGSWLFNDFIEISLSEAAESFQIAYSTLAQAAREGRIEARRSGTTWLTTRAAIERAIEAGHLKPRTEGR